MRESEFTNRFRKDVKRLKKRGKNRSKLKFIIEYICNHGDAPLECRPHNLSGNWSGYRECHLEPDWLVIFTVEMDVVVFHRTGTHSDLFR